MNWIVSLTICFVLWSTYVLPGNVAEKTHGVSINFFFETMAFVLVTVLLWSKVIEDAPKVTFQSGTLGMFMGLGSAIGFYFFLSALSLAPNTKAVMLVILVAGVTFPLQSALAGMIFGVEGIKGLGSIRPLQWVALGGMISSIILFNWKS